jgi:hypothetical protein
MIGCYAGKLSTAWKALFSGGGATGGRLGLAADGATALKSQLRLTLIMGLLQPTPQLRELMIFQFELKN